MAIRSAFIHVENLERRPPSDCLLSPKQTNLERLAGRETLWQ